VHNTVTLDSQDQMTRAGRFLWLDWAQAQVIACEQAEDGAWERLVAQHDGYRRRGWLHQRRVTAFQDGRWFVQDSMMPAGTLKRSNVKTLQRFNLHWLLPDWDWEIYENSESRIELSLSSPLGMVVLRMEVQSDSRLSTLDSRISSLESQISQVRLVRAGKLLHGSGEADPILGWVSPTYALKLPALSLTVSTEGNAPVTFLSEWTLP